MAYHGNAAQYPLLVHIPDRDRNLRNWKHEKKNRALSEKTVAKTHVICKFLKGINSEGSYEFHHSFFHNSATTWDFVSTYVDPSFHPFSSECQKDVSEFYCLVNIIQIVWSIWSLDNFFIIPERLNIHSHHMSILVFTIFSLSDRNMFLGLIV